MPSDFLEKTLEDIIFWNRQRIHEKGFIQFFPSAQRQFRLPTGKIIDILTWDIVDNIFYAKIIELKKDITNDQSFWQVLSYYYELMDWVEQNFEKPEITMILVGRQSDWNMAMIAMLSDKIKIYDYDYGYDGITFKQPFESVNDPSTMGEVDRKRADALCDYLKQAIVTKDNYGNYIKGTEDGI